MQFTAALVLASSFTSPGDAVTLSKPMPPPAWALLERELLRASTAACEEFFARFFDARGYLLCVERWGGDDGPDDAIENLTGWPVLHALGAPDSVIRMVEKAWEGHLRQYTQARTVDVPFARDGMYYKEFPVMFDWLHNGEGLTVFNVQGLSDPDDALFRLRVRRYAGFYMNEDPQAPNYDPEHKVIRSIFNGSRGPLLRKATAVDWAGDPIEVEGRFKPRHGERTYAEMLAHFKDYNEVVGDSPMNLSATTLALNAYMLENEEKYRRWLLEYVGAWVERTRANGGIIPTNIGLDGKIGGSCGGKWYGGVYGWGFSVAMPQTGALVHRNQHGLALTGFGNAYMLTGDRKYLDVWRVMIDKVNAQAKTMDGRTLYPSMHGDEGWYAYGPDKYSQGAREIYYWSMDREDLKRLPVTGWLAYLEGKDPGYPEKALQAEFLALGDRVRDMRADTTTPDTRLADDPLVYNPARVDALIELMLGGMPPGNRGTVLHARVRYFDPAKRRAGLPSDVAALVEAMTGEETTIALVNIHATEGREVIVQAGAYGEHRFTSVEADGEKRALDSPLLTVRLAPGSGGRLRLGVRRYANAPTLAFPWARR